MSPKKTDAAAEKIKLLISFLDEDNEEIIENIEKELLRIDPETNNLLISQLVENENYKISERLIYITKNNLLRFFEDHLFEWVNNPDRKIFDLLFIIARLEYPALNKAALDGYYDKILKKLWLKIENESSALDVTQTIITFLKVSFEINFFEEPHIEQMHINKVFETNEFCPPMLDFLLLAIAQDLKIPVVPIGFEKKTAHAYYKFWALAFENKAPYNISFFDQPYLFFILTWSLLPIPESELFKRVELKEGGLNRHCLSARELVVVLLRKLAYLYKSEKNLFYADKLEALMGKIIRS